MCGKVKSKILERYSVIAASVIPLVFILKYNRLELWNYHSLADWKNWMILAVTVLLSAIVISINQVAEIPRGKRIIALCVRWCLYGNPAAYDDADI